MAQNKNKKRLGLSAMLAISVISFGLAIFFVAPSDLVRAADDITTLNQKIDNQKKSIDALQKQIDFYQQQISLKQKETATLQNQIAILSNEVAKVNLDIQSTQGRIEQTNLEIQSLNIAIEITEQKISDRKEKLAEYIRLINKGDQITYFEIILTKENFSDFFDQIQYTQQIHSNIKTTLDTLKNDRQQLDAQKIAWQQKAELENKLKDQLEQQRISLEEKTGSQQILLAQTRLSAKQYKSNTYQLQLQQQQINADIVGMEKQIRTKLEVQKKQNQFATFGPAVFNWPLNPIKGISTYFHDPEYPFRYIFEHPAIDIRTPQGTKITAPEAGYVARVQFRGDKSYAYIMLIHTDGLSTVYGHASAVYVKPDDYVTKGQAIGLSGGTPGTVGSGPLTTGPHLHFEVRLNGIPVNPLEYLPSL